MSDTPLLETALADAHRAAGGKLVDFGGWAMPLNYGSQIEEHHVVRKACGLFDVSHMTVVDLVGDESKAYLQNVLANDVAKLKQVGQALYTGMLNEQGGVIDDLIVYLQADAPATYRLVVNCATREKDLSWLQRQAKAFDVVIEEKADLAMLAVQGPTAQTVMSALLNGHDQQTLADLKPFTGAALTEASHAWFVARTGYTGEDGFELILPNTQAPKVWQALVAAGAFPCGLGARDTLRLEAGMNLYGHEMDDAVSPLEANMAWTVSGLAERDFIGASALREQKAAGVSSKLVGMVMRSKGVLRAGYPVRVPESDQLGVITSGTFSPTLGHAIALARLPVEALSQAQVQIRNKWVDVELVKPGFVRKGQAVIRPL